MSYQTSLSAIPAVIAGTPNPAPVFAPPVLLNQVTELLDRAFTLKDYEQRRNNTNPFENLGNSIFLNRAAVKMAELDSLFHLTDQGTSFLEPQNLNINDPFVFCDI